MVHGCLQKTNGTGIGISRRDWEDREAECYMAYLGKNCSVLDGELTAIKKATEISLRKDRGEVLIRTDSKWALEDIKRELPHREITTQIQKNLLTLQQISRLFSGAIKNSI